MQLATEVNLVTCSAPSQGGEVVSDAARSVQFLGTTAPTSKSLGNPEYVADLEYIWRSRTTEPAKNLSARARRLRKLERDIARIENARSRMEQSFGVLAPTTIERDPRSTCRSAKRVRLLRAAEWAEHRARALAMTRTDVVSACDERWRQVACGCGVREMRVGCDQPLLCVACRKRHAVKWRRRITDGMEHALKRERAEWFKTPAYRRRGMKPGIYLITLTGPHSGDLNTDREAMAVAVRKLLKHATKHGWWNTYALTWEATSGPTKNAPYRAKHETHLHVHLAVISSWIPYRRREIVEDECDVERWDSESPNAGAPRGAWAWRGERRNTPWGKPHVSSARGLHDVWRDALPGALVVDVKAPRNAANDAWSTGDYLAKYVTKGVNPAEFTGRKAGELLCAFRSRRKVSTSTEFWLHPPKQCECCHQSWRSTGAPCSLQELAPGAVLRSMSERTRYRDVDRFRPQVMLRRADETPLVPRPRVTHAHPPKPSRGDVHN